MVCQNTIPLKSHHQLVKSNRSQGIKSTMMAVVPSVQESGRHQYERELSSSSMSCKKSPPNFYLHCSTQQKYNIHGYQRKESVLPYTAPTPETHAGARSPEHPNISLFVRRTSLLIILIKIPAPIIQHLYWENKRALTTSVIRARIKKGSYLLSRIALQYHRRNRA